MLQAANGVKRNAALSARYGLRDTDELLSFWRRTPPTLALFPGGSFIDPQRRVLFHETRRSIGTNPRGASLSMKHFLNDDLAAPNALVVRVDHDIVRELLPLSRDTPPGPGY